MVFLCFVSLNRYDFSLTETINEWKEQNKKARSGLSHRKSKNGGESGRVKAFLMMHGNPTSG